MEAQMEISKLKRENKHYSIVCEGYEKMTKEYRDEVKQLKERLSIMKAMAGTHIQDMNEIHDDYRTMIVKLKDEITELKEQIDGDGLWGVNQGLKKEKLDLIKENSELKEFINQHKVNVVKLDDTKKFIEGDFISTEYTTNRDDGFPETTETINLYIQKRTPKTLLVMRANGLNGTERYKIHLDDDGNEYIKLFHNFNVGA